MKAYRLPVVMVVILVALLALSSMAAAARLDGSEHGGRPFAIAMTGAAEAPGPGDPDGSGLALITLNQGQEEVCFDITVENVDAIAAAHIHRAPAGSPGPVVVNFNVAANGLNGCVTAAADLIQEIRQNPSAFYVNVHNPAFPAGAVRGQLAK